MTDDAIKLDEIDAEIKESSQGDSPIQKQNLPFSTLAGDETSDPIIGKLERSQSLYNPVPQVSDLVIEKSEADFKPDSSINLRERAILKYKIQSGNIQEA